MTILNATRARKSFEGNNDGVVKPQQQQQNKKEKRKRKGKTKKKKEKEKEKNLNEKNIIGIVT